MGDIADWLIDQMIEEGQWSTGTNRRERRPKRDYDPFYYDSEPSEPKTLQDFAEDTLDDAKRDKKTKNLNKGVIDW